MCCCNNKKEKECYQKKKSNHCSKSSKYDSCGCCCSKNHNCLPKRIKSQYEIWLKSCKYNYGTCPVK